MIGMPAIKRLIIAHEGVSYTAYRDSKGFLTVGVGFNLDEPTAEATCSSLGIPYGQVRAGTPLTEEQVQLLFSHCCEIACMDAKSACPQIESLKDNAQLALIDMSFNMGLPKMLEFKHMLEALREKPPAYAKAAIEMRNSLWARQVGRRAYDDMALLLN